MSWAECRLFKDEYFLTARLKYLVYRKVDCRLEEVGGTDMAWPSPL